MGAGHEWKIAKLLILEALRNRDPEAACRQMAAHIVASKEETLSLMNQTPQHTESMVLSELPSDILKELDAIEQFSQLAVSESTERR